MVYRGTFVRSTASAADHTDDGEDVEPRRSADGRGRDARASKQVGVPLSRGQQLRAERVLRHNHDHPGEAQIRPAAATASNSMGALA